ncbi:hypothetical protein MWH28_03865 [Natroniella sulfidigena]|uniref:hypothetical protein n=1 Tax=Natroniella sulfidigena TaxID=723921 RepID=UPI00200B951B|nr:hypothetical protein [Natroniella sulfidigena]MCK8816503.1 hypothetical protein [Natroniella sulfidigena]
MTEPITPKTTLPRSLRINQLEQERQNKPDSDYNQVAQELKKENIKQENRVNKSEETEYKQVDDEDEKAQEQKQEQESKEEAEEDDEQLPSKKRGSYIDIKV